LIKLYIYEDDNDLRDGLCQFLSSTGAFEIIYTFGNCNSIEADLQSGEPDILLMDIDMPGMSGIDGIKIAKKVKPAINILVFTVFDDEKKIFEAICAGADGYLLKKTAPERIVEGLKDVYAGGAPMTASIAKKILSAFPKDTYRDNYTPLTDKEKEVLVHLVSGKSYKEIALAKSISVETVRTHIKHIYAKLHVSSMSQAVAKAIRQKIV
jgi:DNA-binding NarL/FixJ family response regulator